MDEKLKHRIAGGVVLASVAIIAIPMMFGTDENEVKTAKLSESVVPPNPQANVTNISSPVIDQWSDKSLANVVPEPIISDAAPGEFGGEEQAKATPVPDKLLSQAAPAAAATATTQQAPASVAAAKPAPEKTVVQPKPQTAPAAKEPTVAKVESKAQTKPETKSEAKPEAKPQMVTTPTTGKAWVVQVGSFSDRVNAERLRDRLVKSGYRAFVSQTRTGDRTSVRVRVGPELERGNADKIRAKLQKELKMQAVVVEHR